MIIFRKRKDDQGGKTKLNLRKALVILTIIILLTPAIICLRNSDNEGLRSDKSTNNNTEKVPGFEAVFTVIIVLAVVCHFSRKKREEEKNKNKGNERGHR